MSCLLVATPVNASSKDRAIDPTIKANGDRLLVQSNIAEVTGVKLKTTEEGVELTLATKTGKKLIPLIFGDGNNLIIDILDAKLALPNQTRFYQANPTPEIAEITVTQVDATSIQIAIAGIKRTPSAKLVTNAEDLVLSVTPEAAETEANSEEIEILVTAEKTLERPQDVPLSLTVLDDQTIEDANISNFASTARSVPNFSILDGAGSRSFYSYSIRGLGNNNFLSRDAVAFYIDDVPYDYGGFLGLDLFDVERIEVLRGTQSTLYGRSALSGVVNVITRQPSNKLEFSGDISYGNINDLDLKGSINLPLDEDKLFLRLSGGYGRQDGYISNSFNDENIGDQSGGAGRGQLLWTPSEDWSIALSSSFYDYDDGIPLVPIDSEPFEVEQDGLNFAELNSNTQSLKIAYSHDDFRITSVSARRFSRADQAADLDGTTTSLGVFSSDFDSTSFTQEIRLQSPETAKQLQWIVGTYFEFRDFNTERDGLTFGADAVAVFELPEGTTNLRDSESNENYWAIFGQTSYQVTKALNLTAGLRYETYNTELENLSQTVSIPEFPSQTLFSLQDVEQDDDILLPKFALDYRLNPNLTLYSTIARGYRPGGVNFRATSQETATFEAEKSWNYELGLKSSFLDDKLGLNFAVFHNPVKDYQVQILGQLVQVEEVVNADARITGFELEGRATPTKGLDFTAGFGYANTEFTDFPTSGTGEDFDGNTLPIAPEFTYNLAAQYRSPSKNGILGRVELQGTGQTFFEESNELKQEAYGIFNAKLGYEFNSSGVYFFANNIFDTKYLTQAADIGTGVVGQYGAPATYGLQFSSKF